jgi:hypothetical protein
VAVDSFSGSAYSRFVGVRQKQRPAASRRPGHVEETAP